MEQKESDEYSFGDSSVKVPCVDIDVALEVSGVGACDYSLVEDKVADSV